MEVVHFHLVLSYRLLALCTPTPLLDPRAGRVEMYDASGSDNGSTKVRAAEHPADGALQETALFGRNPRIFQL